MTPECLATMTPESCQAIAHLRRADHLQWPAVNALAFVFYAYASMLRRGEKDDLVLAIGFWAVEFLWEMFNALVLKFTGKAALWTIAGQSSYLLYVGLNVEIAFMFAVAPIVLFYLLKQDRSARVLGLPNRLFIPIVLGMFCVAVECVLNLGGLLVWHWWFWRFPFVPLIVVAYSGPFTALVWIRDNVSRDLQRKGAVAAIVLAIAAHAVLAGALGWV